MKCDPRARHWMHGAGRSVEDARNADAQLVLSVFVDEKGFPGAECPVVAGARPIFRGLTLPRYTRDADASSDRQRPRRSRTGRSRRHPLGRPRMLIARGQLVWSSATGSNCSGSARPAGEFRSRVDPRHKAGAGHRAPRLEIGTLPRRWRWLAFAPGEVSVDERRRGPWSSNR